MKYDAKRDFHAMGDGRSDDSAAFSMALSHMESGDILSIPAGTYVSGPITVNKDGITIRLEAGSVIRFVDDPVRYVPVMTRWEGVCCYAMHPCFWITGCSGVTLTGEGTLDGNGVRWWNQAKKKKAQIGPETAIEKEFARLNPRYESQPGGGGGRPSQFLRPPLLQVLRSENVLIEGITLQNSPFWTLHPVFSKGIRISRVTVNNPEDAPNTDGIDIDSCQNVEVSGCEVTVGDDGIAIKSGIGEDAVEIGIPTTDVSVTGCVVHRAHGGAVIGSETGGGIHRIQVSNCCFDGTDRGIRIKTRRGRAGEISDLFFRDVTVHGALCPLTINMYYVCGTDDSTVFSLERQPVTELTPSVKDVTVQGLVADGIRSMGAFIVGLPERPVKHLVLQDCTFALVSDGLEPVERSEMYYGLPENPTRGLRLRNVEVHLSRVTGECVFEDGVKTF